MNSLNKNFQFYLQDRRRLSKEADGKVFIKLCLWERYLHKDNAFMTNSSSTFNFWLLFFITTLAAQQEMLEVWSSAQDTFLVQM